MDSKMTKTEARAWKTRWQLVNDFEREELRATPIERKLHQLAAMMAMAEGLDWHTSTEAEINAIRHRWVQLKEKRDAAR